MTARTHVPTDVIPAVRTLVLHSALRWVVELQDNGRLAVLQTPAPSSGERILWGFLGSLVGHKTDVTFFDAASIDEDSQHAVVEALRVYFGHKASEAAA